MPDKITITDAYPLLPAQRGLLVDSLAGEGENYRQQICIELNMPITDMMQSIERLVANHQILRTVFDWSDGEPLQIVVDGLKPNINTFHIPKDGSLSDILNKEIKSLKPVSDAPPIRFAIIKDSGKLFLAITYHHILLDGPSVNIMLEEIATGTLSNEVAPPIYIEWLKQNVGIKETEYWRSTSTGVTKSSGDIDSVSKERVSNQRKTLGKQFYNEVLKTCKEFKITPAVCLQALWSMWATQYFEKNELLYGLVSSTRIPSLTDTALGPYIATIPCLAYNHFNDLAKTINYVNEANYDTTAAKHIPLGDIAKIASPFMINFETILTITTQPIKSNSIYTIISTHENTGYKLSVDIEIGDTICITFSGTLDSLKEALDSFTHYCKQQIKYSYRISILEHHKNSRRTSKNKYFNNNTLSEILIALSQLFNISESNIDQSCSFLDLGGDSIFALRFKTILNNRGLNISIGDIIQSSSITDLASKASQYHTDIRSPKEKTADKVEAAGKLVDTNVVTVTKISDSTRTILDDYVHGFGQDYHEQSAFRLKGNFDSKKFAHALWLLGQECSVFRMIYHDELPNYQIETTQPRIELLLDSQTEDSFGQFVEKTSRSQWKKLFSAQEGPLLRCVVLSRPDIQEWYLFMSFSALITDGWSFSLMLEKLFKHYSDTFNQTLGLSKKAVDLSTSSKSKNIRIPKEVLEDFDNIVGENHSLDKNITDAILARAKNLKTTPSELVQSIFSLVLRKENFSSIFVHESGRNDTESFEIIGPFSYLSEHKLNDDVRKIGYFIYENYPKDSEEKLKKGEVERFEELENWRKDLLPPRSDLGAFFEVNDSGNLTVRIVKRKTSKLKKPSYYWQLLLSEFIKI